MRTQLHYLYTLLTCLVLMLCLGCEARSKQDVRRQLDQVIAELKNQGDASIKEVDKLHQLEYTVLSLPADGSAQLIEGALDELGRKRWDCFHVEKSTQVNRKGIHSAKLLVFCKRLPETFLRYIPKNFIGR